MSIPNSQFIELGEFLYPDGQSPPASNTIPELHVPLRVGLAFLPSQSSSGSVRSMHPRSRCCWSASGSASRHVSLSAKSSSSRTTTWQYPGFCGTGWRARLYNVDVMALVSYDQVMHTDDNKWSLGYLTIVGAYILPGNTQDSATLVDLVVVDPATRSLVLRAGARIRGMRRRRWSMRIGNPVTPGDRFRAGDESDDRQFRCRVDGLRDRRA